ncbi:MAG TPA: class I SAM-dependent methyltransferase [Candidatus Rubneribacter avistercoris]|nr:class I SAM-dependent methyltransferase [Candidatus Rubneribacter avistercoris]
MDDRKQKSRIAFDAQAPTYDSAAQGAHARGLYPHVLTALARVPCGGELLDVGCGTGALARLVLKQDPTCRVTGLDLAPNMVAQARANLEGFADRVRLVEGDSDRLPFREESFDAAWCNDSFHHYPDPERVAFEVWRVLRPGGLFAMGDVALPAPARVIMNAAMPFSNEGDVRIYARGELERILGRWFSSVVWRRVGASACLVEAWK